jgi:hypothetical protein
MTDLASCFSQSSTLIDMTAYDEIPPPWIFCTKYFFFNIYEQCFASDEISAHFSCLFKVKDETLQSWHSRSLLIFYQSLHNMFDSYCRTNGLRGNTLRSILHFDWFKLGRFIVVNILFPLLQLTRTFVLWKVACTGPRPTTTWSQCYKTFYIRNEQEYLSLAGLSSQV